MSCRYCGDRCERHFVYVIGEPLGVGTIKVGYTKKPAKRIAGIRQKSGRPLVIVNLEPIECEFKAMDIEAECHRRLAAHWSGQGEWFNCSATHAVEVLGQVVADLGRKGAKP